MKKTKHDWTHADAMTDEQVEAAALADPDAQPMTDAQLARKPVARSKTIRRALGLTQEAFSERYGIALGTLRDWEQGKTQPDQTAKAYLKIIATDPEKIALMVSGRRENRLTKTTRSTAASAKKTMHVPMPEGVHLTRQIPENIRLAIADAVVVFGQMEQEIIEISWILKTADLQQRLKLARIPATENFIAVLEVVEQQSQGLRLDALKSTFRRLAEERNLIVHGSWTMANDKPWVVWHKFAEDTDSIIGEYFEIARFDRFMKTGRHLMSTLQQFHNMIEATTGVKTTAVPRRAIV